MENEVVITYAALHDVVFIPGAGQFGPTLTNDATGKTKDLKMTLLGNELLQLSIGKAPGKVVKALIPLATVKIMIEASPTIIQADFTKKSTK